MEAKAKAAPAAKKRKPVVAVIGLLILLIAAAAIFVGFAYRGQAGTLADGMPSIAFVDGFVRDVLGQFSYREKRELQIIEHGLLPIFVTAGGVLFLIGMWMLIAGLSTGAKKAPAEKKKKKKVEVKRKVAAAPVPAAAPAAPVASGSSTAPADSSAPADTSGGSGGGADMDAAFSALDDILDDPSKKDDIMHDEAMHKKANELIALSHTNLEDDQMNQVIGEYLPIIQPHIDYFSDKAKNKVAHQLLSRAIVDIKRQERGISADQFKLQDEKVNELARETVARLYLPPQSSWRDEKILPHLGLAYSIYEQKRVQQSLLSASDDWIDLSLRNADEVFTQNADKFKEISTIEGAGSAIKEDKSDSDEDEDQDEDKE